MLVVLTFRHMYKMASSSKTVCDSALKTLSKGENAVVREKFRHLEERIMQLEKIEDRMDALEIRYGGASRKRWYAIFCVYRLH